MGWKFYFSKSYVFHFKYFMMKYVDGFSGCSHMGMRLIFSSPNCICNL